jgi:hypothetical protein
MLHLDPQTAECDPDTGQPWPRWLDTVQAARYATQVIGIPIEPQTLANYRAAGKALSGSTSARSHSPRRLRWGAGQPKTH